jgi:hypothetical protein
MRLSPLIFLAWIFLVAGPALQGYGDPPIGEKAPATESAQPGFKPKAPHGGLLLDAGDDFAHVEMVFDSVEGSLTAYILDGEAEEAVPLKQPSILVRLTKPARTLKLRAVVSPLNGEKPGATSSYALADPSLKGLTQLKGVLVSVNINGSVFKNLAFQFPAEKE